MLRVGSLAAAGGGNGGGRGHGAEPSLVGYQRASKGIEMQSTSVEFLLCRYSGGYLVTISGFWGNHNIEGWVAGA